MKTVISDFMDLFYPKKCPTCAKIISNFEEILCLSCKMELSQTNFTEYKENKMEKSFYGRIPVEEATSLLYFQRKGIVQRLIHQLKYKNQQQIGLFLGKWLGEIMLESNRFKSLNCIVTVPLHPEKFKKRGYNQVTTFGQGLAEKLKIPLEETKLYRVSKATSQTYRNRIDRWQNVKHEFELKDGDFFKNKHILLIDDVITTGATLESCGRHFLNIKGVKISMATMVFTE